jgi:hypothetical protein
LDQRQIEDVMNSGACVYPQTVALSAGEQTELTFTWDTTAWPRANYTIYAAVWPVGDEINVENNFFVGSHVVVTIPGDVRFDKTVNVLDLILIANHLGHTNGESHTPFSKEWYECMNTDIQGDGQHNVLDLIICANHLGETLP